MSGLDLDAECVCSHAYGDHAARSLRCLECRCPVFREKVRTALPPQVVFVTGADGKPHPVPVTEE